MKQPNRQRGKKKRFSVWAKWLRLGMVTALAGCQAVPAHVATCHHPQTLVPRPVIVARQIAIDTALETVQHPRRSLSVLAVEPLLAVREGTAGLHKRALRLAATPGPVTVDGPTLDADALEDELRHIAEDELEPANIQIITDGPQALATLEDALAQATCQIDVLMYIWDNDPVGWDLARRLAARASADVRVRVLVDGAGNLLQGEPKAASAGEANRVVCWLARQPNVQVIRTRNPFLRFDHRKFVLIDGRLVWSGGRNFNRESFFESHDLSYLLTGPLTGELAARYERFWQRQGGATGPAPQPPLSVHEVNVHARLVRTRPYEYNLARTVYTAVDRARHHVYLENPYFTDNRLFVKLVQARQRGVDVRVMLTLRSGSTLIDIANPVTVNRLLKAGIRVYLYPGLTHVKALSVDGVWAYIGTGNFDPLSLEHNHELGLALSHGPLVGELEERLFLIDFRSEWEVCTPLPLVGYQLVIEVVTSMFL